MTSHVERRPDRTLGLRHDDFWAYCANDELRMQRCVACREWTWPVAEACAHCGATDLPFIRLSGLGRVIGWATFERDYYGGLLPVPWDTILVALDEGPLFISNPTGFGYSDITHNLRVTVTFLDAADHAGHFRLPVFELASDR